MKGFYSTLKDHKYATAFIIYELTILKISLCEKCPNTEFFLVHISILISVENNIMEVRGPFVGNKSKGRISKRVFQENKARLIFRKNEHFLPPDTHTYVSVLGGEKCSFLEKLVVLCLLETPVLPYFRQTDTYIENFSPVFLRNSYKNNFRLDKDNFSGVHCTKNEVFD